MLKVMPIQKNLGGQPVSAYQEFQFNVEGFASNSINFLYEIGDGPLYWWRLDWYETPCPDQPIIDIPPVISYERGFPSCPVEVTDICEIFPPVCPCEPSCAPGLQCFEEDVEMWHMLASSMTHLCYRINNECCHRNPNKFVRRVLKYLRPALCCDVDNFNENKIPYADHYIDVTDIFINTCECANLVDPCLALIIYPWHINNCGIKGLVYTGPLLPAPPAGGLPSVISFSAVNMEPITAIQPRQIVLSKITNKFGPAISEVLQCQHNLNECNLLKGLKQDSVDLYYDKNDKIWRGSQYYKDWKMLFEWQMTDELGYKFNLYLHYKNLKSKIFLHVKGVGFEDFTKQQIYFIFNLKKGSINKGILRSKIVQDDIGLFKNWDNFKINLKG